jgi:class 3 adenylate cyclase
LGEDAAMADPSAVRSRNAVAVAALLTIPLLGLALLLARPELDVMWEHHPSHFWLVLGVALVNVALGWLTSEAARRRGDTRLFLVSLALLSSAGFLALHALATPGILLSDKNTGFVIATAIGLLLAAVLAAASALDHERFEIAPRHRQRAVRFALLGLLLTWAVVSLSNVSALGGRPPEEAPLALRVLAPIGVGLYAFAAIRYADVYRRRRRTLPLAVTVAFVLLAEAMIAVIVGRSWHASWWEWHVLMAVAFGVIAAAARLEYGREGSFTAAFGGLYLDRTLDRLDRRSSAALAAVTGALAADDPLTPVLEGLRAEGFGAEELDMLERSARELRRVDALFRPYIGPRLAEQLEREPARADLGGRSVDVTALFADLAGFTAFSERRSAAEVVEMLNAHWAVVVPAIAEVEGGLIERFAGDAILAVFNALEDQPDHAIRAVRAGFAIRDRTAKLHERRPDWPRFRIGVNTGPAVVGNVGAGGHRSFTAIGDTTNVAARLQAAARPGELLLTAATYGNVADVLTATLVPGMQLKGKAEPVDVYVAEWLRSA